jgi:hypothetical protein
MRPGAFTICDHDQVATTVKDAQVGQDDTTSMTAALVGLAGFRLLSAAQVGGELELLVETTAELVGCPRCGAVGRAKDRRPTWVRDLPVGGRAVVLCWWKRAWSCPHPLRWSVYGPTRRRDGGTLQDGERARGHPSQRPGPP